MTNLNFQFLLHFLCFVYNKIKSIFSFIGPWQGTWTDLGRIDPFCSLRLRKSDNDTCKYLPGVLVCPFSLPSIGLKEIKQTPYPIWAKIKQRTIRKWKLGLVLVFFVDCIPIWRAKEECWRNRALSQNPCSRMFWRTHLSASICFRSAKSYCQFVLFSVVAPKFELDGGRI